MKMGIKEFRERISEVNAAGEPVIITNHGKPVGTYSPIKPKSLEAAKKAAESVARWQAEMRAEGIEPEDWLAEMGLDPWGVPLEDHA